MGTNAWVNVIREADDYDLKVSINTKINRECDKADCLVRENIVPRDEH